MIDSVHNVNENFYKEIMGGTISGSLTLATYRDNYAVANLSVPIRYARKSAYDRVELDEVVYPVISIQDFAPKVNEEMVFVHYKERLSGFEDTDADGVDDTVRGYTEGVPLLCRFEIGLAAKSEREHDAMRHYFQKNFGYDFQKCFIFNKQLVPTDDNLNELVPIGDGVFYTIEFEDVPRSDGVIESNVIFVLKPWVDFKDPVVYDLVQQLNINFTIKQN